MSNVEGESRAAYPVSLGHPEDSEAGIDVLTYLAARAPHQPSWAFAVVGVRPRPQVVVPASQSPDGEPVYDGDWWEWEQEVHRATRAQWPWVWARAVLEARRLIEAQKERGA